ncbi:MAG TPA: Bcr/CflA family multidrug efflux MFS transporter [Candidatus Dormibacteraeota bacterium]|nr:Bcr/CflA family multidrug efflux MFS transporter [Candidatus Dormibacteraeota bacterium]
MAAPVAVETRWQRLSFFLVIGALTAFAPLSIDMYLPALPSIASDFHTGPSAVQLTLTAFVAGIALGQLLAGPVSDAIGRRRPLFVGIAGYTVASLLCAVAPNVFALTGLRFIQGLTGAAGVVIARAIVRDLYSGIAAARYFSLLMLITGLAPILAPTFGGQLLRATSWRGVFLVLALVGAAIGVVTAVRLHETLPPERRRPGGLRDTGRAFGELFSDRVFVGYAVSGSLAFSTIFTYISGSSFVLQGIYGMSPQTFALAFGLNACGLVGATQINRRLAGSVPIKTLLVAGLVLMAAASLALLVTAGAHLLGLAGILVPLFLVMTGLGFVIPNSTALALSRHPRAAGTASALLGAMQMGSGAVVAPLVGIAGSGTALPMAVVMAALGLTAVVSLVVLTRPARVPPPAVRECSAIDAQR